MERIIGKDIRNYKIREVGPFSLREAIFGALTLISAYGAYIAQKLLFGDYSYIPIFLAAAPFVALGFLKPYGLPFEKWFSTVFAENFLSPAIRPYVSDREGEEMAEYIKENAMIGKTPVKTVKLSKEEKGKYKSYL